MKRLSNRFIIGLGIFATIGLLAALGGLFYLQQTSPERLSDPQEAARKGVSRPEKGPLIGKSVKDFPDEGLVNQDGESARFEKLPDQPTVLSFIYTRCPMKKMCPLITKKMREIQKAFAGEKKTNLHLVSVTFDPEHDTPKVLKKYGKERGVQFANWDFWTGPPQTIEKLSRRFNIMASQMEGGKISHNMRTYLLGPEQKIRYSYSGSDWKVSELQARLKSLTE